MDDEEALANARAKVLNAIVRYALERHRISEGVRHAVEATKARSSEIAKVMRGMNSHVPQVRSVWTDEFGHRTPAESASLVNLMSNPPGQKGRPKGTGYEDADFKLMPAIHERKVAGEKLKSITEQLAASMGLASTQTEGAAIRLQRRYRQWLKTHKK